LLVQVARHLTDASRARGADLGDRKWLVEVKQNERKRFSSFGSYNSLLNLAWATRDSYTP